MRKRASHHVGAGHHHVELKPVLLLDLLHHVHVAHIVRAGLAGSAKMPDLNAASLESAMSMVAGTARSMGVVVGE